MTVRKVALSAWSLVARPLIAIVAALVIGAVLLLVLSENPIYVYAQLFKGGLQGWPNIAVTLQAMTPLIFTGLAVAFSFRGGLWNVGVEGQLLMGALAAGYVGYALHLPAPLHVAVSLLAAMTMGALWAAIPGILRAYLNVNELVMCLMLNPIALYITSFFASRVLKAPGPTNKLPDIQATASLGQLSMFSQLNIGIFVAIGLVALLMVINFRTSKGFDWKMVGLSPRFAFYSGIDVRRNMVLIMMISGAIAGLGGAEQALGVYRAYYDGFSPGYGFDGIAVAMLADNHPIGVVLSAFLLGALNSGSAVLQMTTSVTRDLVKVLQAMIILFLAAQFVIRLRTRTTNTNETAPAQSVSTPAQALMSQAPGITREE